MQLTVSSMPISLVLSKITFILLSLAHQVFSPPSAAVMINTNPQDDAIKLRTQMDESGHRNAVPGWSRD